MDEEAGTFEIVESTSSGEDKWDASVNRIKNAILAEEAEAALAGALGLFADFGRTLDRISDSLSQIATSAEAKKFDL